ncbi:hypothetical protein PFTANZ_06205, partial [Plasmodium falciparum Tanzania (2000708)]
MDKVKSIDDYWKKPFENFEKDILRNKCKCKPEAPPAKVPSACEILDKILKGKDGKSKIDGCNPKNYKGWNCSPGQFEEGHSGACMPPRRQSLCIHYLENDIDETKTKDDLREAFIQSAGVETFLLWTKYKENKKEEKKDVRSTSPEDELQKQLKDGTIPEEFKRRMFYTFGDYRDLCVGTDISSKVNTSTGVGKVEKNIDAVLQKINRTTSEQRKNWWKTIENDVWKGMLCALSYDSNGKMFKNDVHTKLTNTHTYSTVTFSDNKTTLEEFAKRPQFLRWMTEWADQFCREHKVEKGK